MKSNLIAFTGPTGSGKDLAATWVMNRHAFGVHFKFSRRMKDALMTMLDLTVAQVSGDDRDIIIDEFGKTPREILCSLGTDWGQDMIHPNIWTKGAAKAWFECQDDDNDMVISDLRFNHQAKWVRNMGGVVIHLRKAGCEKSDGKAHPSEEPVEIKIGDYHIENDKAKGTGPFYQLIDQAINEIIGVEGGPGVEITKMESIQNQISSWADEVFPDRTIMNAISKLVLEEIPEYLTSQHDPMELADCGILLYDIAHLAGVDLEKAIIDKMKINRGRKWVLDKKTGLMNHVKEEKHRPTVMEEHFLRIPLTEVETYTGMDRLRFADLLIRQLPKDHDERNIWLARYGEENDT